MSDLYKNDNCGVYQVKMKVNLHLEKYFLPALVAAGLLIAALNFSRINKAVPAKSANDNPGKFHLWTTDSSCEHTFIYDPRGLDQWMFHGGLIRTNAAAHDFSALLFYPKK